MSQNSSRMKPPPTAWKFVMEACFVLFLLVLSGLLLYVPKNTAVLHFDCSAYAAQSVNIAGGDGNTMRWGKENIPGFYPPGYPALTAPFHWILGYDLQNGIVANFVMGFLTVLGVYFLGWRVAGPFAGGTAVLLLLKSEVFVHVAQMLYSQMSSLLFLVLTTLVFLAGWRRGRHAALLRLFAGFLCGMTVLIRNNAALSPAVALFALLIPPPEGTGRLKAAFTVWVGIGLAALACAWYNTAAFGTPFTTGYMSWGFTIGKTFSLDYIFSPAKIQMDEGKYQLLRSVAGFGLLYSWPVALSALIGLVSAWFTRLKNPDFWRVSFLAALSTLVLYMFLALYFFRSPIYTMLTLPLIMVVAGAGAVKVFDGLRLCLQGLSARLNAPPFKGMSLKWLAVFFALIYLLPSFGEAWIFNTQGRVEDAKDVHTFKEADMLMERHAVLLGAANPLLADYIFVRRDTDRKYCFLSTHQGERFKQRVAEELGSLAVSLDGISLYIVKRFQQKRPVYFTVLMPAQPRDIALIKQLFEFFQKRFTLEKTRAWNIYRVKPQQKSMK